ncbi:MAG: carbohydrate binding family 9 domain-containing protein, partial [Burkholderiales bacterium]
MARCGTFVLCATLSTAGVAAGQTPTSHSNVPVVQGVRASAPIVIDGRLGDEAWLVAPAATDFTQRDPDEGKPVTERTELRVAYDDRSLYVGVRLYDREPARIARQLARRDSEAEADAFTLVLDAHHDHLTGAIFSVSAAGVQSDATVYNDSWDDRSWDAVWESAVEIDESGWSLEIRIPYSQLRFPAAEKHTFGINAMRYIQRKNERAWLV